MDLEAAAAATTKEPLDEGSLGDEVEEEEEEYIESEPILSYLRMKNDIAKILQKDSVSCIKAGLKIIVLGTHWGQVYILDHEGTKTMSKENHQTTVNDVVIDPKQEYVASCGDDGKVCIFGLYENTHDQSVEFNRPIKSVEMDPNFSTSFSFVTGDTKLVLTEKGFMGRRKTNILHEGEGIIRAIKWNNDLIAWSNEKGVKIYSVTEKRVITFITKDHDASLRDELYRCTLVWIDADTLVIGWADKFKILKIVRRHGVGMAPPSNTTTAGSAIAAMAATVLSSGAGIAGTFVSGNDKRDLGTHAIIISSVETDFYISGLAPFKEQFLVLCTEKPEEEAASADGLAAPVDNRPFVRVIELQPDSFEEISIDAVTIKEFEKCLPRDYRLDYVPDEDTFFILAPRDVIKVNERLFDDHISWLIERSRFEEALEDIKSSPSKAVIYTYQVVALKYIEFLIASKKYKEAADWCSKITLDVKNWEQKILIFAKEGKLEEIYEKIPSNNPTLSPVIYEKVLNEFLRLTNYQVFKYLIRKWPCDIYDLKCITNAVLDVQRRDTSRVLLESLAILYEYQKLLDKSFVIYINLADQAVFEFLVKHNLYECAFENIIALIELDQKKAVGILVDNVDKLPVKRVVEQLSKNKRFLHYYLDSLFQKDPNISRDYHTMQVVLYAEYEREKLLKFLQNSQYIILAQAQKELQERNLIPEIVYILERMGQIKKAFQLVLHAIKDVNQAIEFCKKHNDKDLWEDLIKYSLTKPDYIIALLNNIGTHVDPVELIDRIPNGLKIKGLRDALVKILQDYRVQLSLLEGSKTIMSGDCLNLMDKQIRVVKQGIHVDDDQKCLICETPLFTSQVSALRRLTVFECRHTYHEECIQQASCAVCSQSKHSTSFALNSEL